MGIANVGGRRRSFSVCHVICFTSGTANNLSSLRIKARNAIYELDKQILNARWKVAHDMCSLLTCCNAFELCRDVGNAYDLGMH